MSNGQAHISKLDFPTIDSRTPLLNNEPGSSDSSVHSDHSYQGAYHGRFFERVAKNIQEKDKRRILREVQRYVSFIWAIVSWYEQLSSPLKVRSHII